MMNEDRLRLVAFRRPQEIVVRVNGQVYANLVSLSEARDVVGSGSCERTGEAFEIIETVLG